MGIQSRRKRLAAFLGVFLLVGGQAEVEKPKFPPGWSGWFGGVRDGGKEEYTIFIDRALKHGGKASCTIRSEVPDPASGGGKIIQLFQANDYRGKRLRMSAFTKAQEVKATGTGSGAFLFLIVGGEKKLSLAEDLMEERKIQGTTKWKKYALVLDIPADAAFIMFGMWLGGTGQVWVDDFEFDVVGKDVMTTGGIPNSRDRSGAIRKDFPQKPRNLGFEE
jgi:hypothetical protein